MKLFFLIGLVLFTLSSCATGEKFVKIREGMSKSEVVEILGQPDVASRDSYAYLNRMVSGWSWDKANYVIKFEDNKVSSYGREGYVDNSSYQYNSASQALRETASAIRQPANEKKTTNCTVVRVLNEFQTRCEEE